MDKAQPAAAETSQRWATATSGTLNRERLRVLYAPLGLALGNAVLLALFGIAMAVSFGIKSLLDHSVFSASAAAVLLVLYEGRKQERES
jgi:hypothetical protein